MKKITILFATIALFACKKSDSPSESLSGSWTMYDSIIVGSVVVVNGTPKVFTISKINDNSVRVTGFPVTNMDFSIKSALGKDSIMTQTTSGVSPSDIAMYDLRYNLKSTSEFSYTNRQIVIGPATSSQHTGRCVKN